MFKYLHHDPDVLEHFLVKAKEKIIDKIVKEFESWEDFIPIYSEKIISLIWSGGYETIK